MDSSQSVGDIVLFLYIRFLWIVLRRRSFILNITRIVIFTFIAFIHLSCSKSTEVDTIFYNGKIFTARNSTEFVEAMAVKNGNIVAVGKTEDLFRKYKPGDTTGINLRGQLVLPGFHDAHLHFWNGAKLKHQVDLRGVRSLQAVLEIIKKAVEKAKPGEWIIGRGWDHELWETKKLPTARDLDKISREHYIYLKRVDGHAAWVNSAVLRLVRYTAKTPDPPGGKIQRHKYTGRPTGILFDAAFDLVDKIIPEPTFSQKYEWMTNTIQYANRLGITSITDISPPELFHVYAQLFEDKLLTLRVNFFPVYTLNLDSLQRFFQKERSDPRFLAFRLVKLYADGSLGSRTAFLKKPYLDDPDNMGLIQYDSTQMVTMVREIVNAGLIVGIHGIGDAAIHQILKVYQQLYKEKPENYRWRIEHAQVMDSSDFPLFAQLGVIASMQPSHCITDMHWAPNRIGERARYAYAWNTFLRHNVNLAFGTDWPVEPLNPMVGLYAAVARKDTTGYPAEGWYPEERITLGEAIRAYTWGSAYAAGIDQWCGTLQPGRVADFVILDRDIFKVPPEEILKTKVFATYINGKPVFTHPLYQPIYPQKQ
ncbi:MAG: amidohydrolase [Calditrichaeota bacterium]|nr:MAG: amidohydrolase [Calditrichota bacterium]